MTRLAVVGLGYVGLPLAVEFGKRYDTVGYDISQEKIRRYRERVDPAGDIPEAEMRAATRLSFTDDPAALADADIYIVAVPTPVNRARRPDFGPLKEASRAIGPRLKKGALVIYESTVFPGATEEICVPELERHSGLAWKRDFNVGYSPERINPGDPQHSLASVVKVVSGDTAETTEHVAKLYEEVVKAGVHRVSSIAVAEAAKVIENTQRDLNIALVNELAIIFNKAGIDTLEVLDAAGTKWNFLAFRPGLVGGHCIGVDPYYLTHKAEMLGYHPQVILAGRRINDNMGRYVAEQTVKQMIAAGQQIKGAAVNVFGLTFKENYPDLRNSRVVELVAELETYGIHVHVHDPVADPETARSECGIDLKGWDALPQAEAGIVAVAHQALLSRGVQDDSAKIRPGGCFIDVKAKFDAAAVTAAGLRLWRL